MNEHPSHAATHIETEALILKAVAEQLGIPLRQGVDIEFADAVMKVDGAAEDESVLVEIFAHVGKLRGGQKHKVSTDALKLLALAESRPGAKLILAFADHEAASSISGWKKAVLDQRGIERIVVELSEQDRAALVAAQKKGKMINAPLESADSAEAAKKTA